MREQYKMVPVEKLKEWEAAINTIALQMAFDIADDIAQYSCAPAVQKHYPSNEWIPSNGQRPDLPGDTLVDVKFLDGFVSTKHRVDYWVWSQAGPDFGDITHYLIHSN